MSPADRERLFGFNHALDHPVTVVVTIVLVALLLAAPLLIWLLARCGRIGEGQRADLLQRYRSWLLVTPLLLGPILLGAAWTILGLGILGLLCYREYARATSLAGERAISLVVVAGMLALTAATLANEYPLFVALAPLTACVIAATAILADRPQGYLQRVALGVLGFILFGTCLHHLAYLANDPGYRPIVILVFLSVEMNDIFAYLVGRALGRRKLAPNTSPGKTVAGAVGALVLTTLLVAGIGRFVLAGTVLEGLPKLAALGVLISVLGQLGDLMVSSIKRDLGIKDMGALLPGQGGLLDRFDSVLLVAPAVFHFINYFVGIGAR